MTHRTNATLAWSTTAVVALLMIWPSGSACNLIDDDQPPLDPSATAGGTAEGGELTCLDAAAQIQASCEYPLQFWVDYSEGASAMTLVDDPAASVGIGPDAWLIQVASSADYVGTYHHEGDDCEMGCGWCARGEHVCHGGLSDAGQPTCWACLPFETPDLASACMAALWGCSGDGLDETGAEPPDEDDDEGVLGTDTGAGAGPGDTWDGFDEASPEPEYDCAMWQPSDGGVTTEAMGVLVVDAGLVEELILFDGEPLSSCDDTRFRLREDGYFAVSRRAEHGLLAALGLAPGDVILAIDGEPLSGLDAVVRAVDERFSYGGRPTSGFSLLIERGDDQIVKSVLVR